MSWWLQASLSFAYVSWLSAASGKVSSLSDWSSISIGESVFIKYYHNSLCSCWPLLLLAILMCSLYIFRFHIHYVAWLVKPQPHEGELTGWIVDELRIRLILGEQRTFFCSFVIGGRSHRNRWRLQRRPMTTRIVLGGMSAKQTRFIAHFSRKQTRVSQGVPVWQRELACRKLWRCVRLYYRSRVAEALGFKFASIPYLCLLVL